LIYATQIVLDIAKTLKAQTWAGNYGFECCDCNGRTKISERFFNRHCMPIEISDRDPVFRGKKCMNYIRAMVSHNNCELKEASVVSF
jgi:Animal haem peroxidase